MDTKKIGDIRSKHFVSITFRDGLLIDLSNDQYPTKAYGWGHEGGAQVLGADGTHFCFVLAGTAKAKVRLGDVDYEVTLHPRMYMACPGPLTIEGGCGIIISRLGYTGMFMLSGPIESKGRLKYIDGCSDSLIIPPVVKGDPCLNHLHFPKQIKQTRHTHPSIRIGVVTKGVGRCVIPDENEPNIDITVPLEPGRLFLIPSEGHHSFFTDDAEMDVIAYHPDTDMGPDHDNHPMINRTIVQGVSAAQIPGIRTK